MQFGVKQLGFGLITIATYIINLTKRESSDI